MKKTKRYSSADKIRIMTEYLSSDESMDAFQMKYGMGHCTLTRWMTKFGLSHMDREQIRDMKMSLEQVPEKSSRELALEAKVALLEKELKDERVRSLAYSVMIDAAEEELGIDLRKKSGAKQ